MKSSTTRRRLTVLLLTTPLAVAGCAGSSGNGGEAGEAGEGGEGPIHMWARASTSSQSGALVEAWNEQNEAQVQLTVVPNDSYLQKVGVAAGSDELPCLMASDVVYMPNYVQQSLYQDITDRVQSLEFADNLAQGHIRLASDGDAIYGVPHNVAVSAIFQNDVLLEEAGIDPDAQLESLEQLAENAANVADLSEDTIGLYYTGNNAGSITFTHFPAIWASGGQPLSEDGNAAQLDHPEAIQVFEIFNEMHKEGASGEGVRSESGATRNDVFATGDVGYMLASNSVVETVSENEGLQIGVQAIPGVGGGESGFVGGDAIGISVSCEQTDAAWDFLEWSLSEEAQVGVFAEMGQLVVRSDLAENEHSAEDPRLVRLNEIVGLGDTPYALRYGQTFNDPQGPALTAFREALFGDDAEAALTEHNEAISQSLGG